MNFSCSPDCLRIDESCRVSKRNIVQICPDHHVYLRGPMGPMASLNLQKHVMERT